MTNKTSANAVPVTMNLKRTFENAVRDIYQAGLNGKVSRQRLPIVQRASTLSNESRANAEKRALSDAARALAQLWKVAPSSTSR
ncbi:MAG TPA: hypothetical protein VGS27_15640 [Candidatus Sulfotelmatobacter sp.]|nr:hypothetical protein [Candidatus Sulfotelmatobacter sp.]